MRSDLISSEIYRLTPAKDLSDVRAHTLPPSSSALSDTAGAGN